MRTSILRQRPAAERRPRVGEYFSRERTLYRVEWVGQDRALIEDCLTESLIDVPLEAFARLRLVERRSREQRAPSTA